MDGFHDPLIQTIYGLAGIGGAIEFLGAAVIPAVRAGVAAYGLAEAGLPVTVYRGLAAGERAAVKDGLTATGPSANISAVDHVAGAKPSQFISTSKSIDTARRHATFKGGNNGVAKIDLTKVNKNAITDVSKGVGRPGSDVNRMSKMSQEVLIQGKIPGNAIQVIE